MANTKQSHSQTEADSLEAESGEEPISPAARVADELRTNIGKGVLAPGARLKELHIAADYGVSRAAVHEALKLLESDGLVQYLPNRGFIVAEMSLQDAQDIYEAREVLEGLAARLFSQRATSSQIEELADAIRGFESVIPSGAQDEASIDVMMKAKSRFYEVLYEGCGNTVVFELLQSLRQRILALRRKTLSHPGRPTETLRELKAILAALVAEEPDKDAAEKAARNHVRLAARVAYNELRRAEAGKRS